MANQPRIPSQPPSERRAFLRRLSIYLFGVALGFVLLGLFGRARQASMPPPPPGQAQPDGQNTPTHPSEAP
ncbi:MAG: hypothetical protein EA378_09290 [Phycisphaerales bacterium]|nr:MAG: hypothetical protein EA378_09290 [Phycisphaerales bacterium]